MAKKNPEHEKTVESETDSAYETGSDSDSDSDSEPRQTQTQSTKKPASSTPAAAKKPTTKPQQPSFTSSESESDSESDGEPNPKDSPKSRKSTNGAKKTSVKPAAADPVSPTRSAAQKRPADEEGADGKASKKPKKKKAEPETEKKATETPKKRVWSEDDELVILQGMIDFKNKKKADPSADLNVFHEFIKKNLNTKDSVTSQLVNKIKRLKRKYMDNKIKEEKMEDGKVMTLSKPHEQKCFELSKSVWGNKNDVKESDRKGAANKRRTVVAEKEDAAAKEDKAMERVVSMGETVEERVLRIGAKKFENGKGGSGEKEWKKLRMEEMEANLKLFEVKAARARLVVESLLAEEP